MDFFTLLIDLRLNKIAKKRRSKKNKKKKMKKFKNGEKQTLNGLQKKKKFIRLLT